MSRETDVPELPAEKLCPDCGAPLPKKAVLCVECGLDLRTGQKLKTVSGGFEEEELEGADESHAGEQQQAADSAERVDNLLPEQAAGGLRKCPRCGKKNDSEEFLCSTCLRTLQQHKRNAAEHTDIVPRLCPYCGRKLLQKEASCNDCSAMTMRELGVLSIVASQCIGCGQKLPRGIVICPRCQKDHAV